MLHMATTKADLASLVLGMRVEKWISARRAAGRTWREVSDDLAAATAGRVTASPESVRTWSLYPHEEDAA